MYRVNILFLISAFLFGNIWSAAGLTCACDKASCASVPPDACPWGVGMDSCFCCQVCLKGPGQTCGGPWNIKGRCGDGLECVRKTPGDFNANGICKKLYKRGSN
ncbi:venom protein 302 [Hyalella azteca]|uniref:Venom protein 302 n=1 Tax=Hyalella azteca TaxID=294128 RepID=A0A8B7N3M0_HYAAZ|nr:venom protein 302 [Hyalella azteca]